MSLEIDFSTVQVPVVFLEKYIAIVYARNAK